MPKYRMIADELRQQIQNGKYASAVSLPSEYELCTDYQVSRQTIRQTLSILEKEGLIVKRRGSGSFIRHNQLSEQAPRRSIAIVTTYISDYIFPSILREAENVLSQCNCTLSLFATQNQVAVERRILENLLTLPIDGLLVEGTKTALPNPNLDLYQKLMQKQLPMVFINGCYGPLYSSISVLDDNAGGGAMLVEHLVAKGHQKIAGIFKSDDMQGHGRYKGYCDGLYASGRCVEDGLVFWYSTERVSTLFSDGLLEQMLLRWRQAGCTAVVCYNDEIAIGLMSKLGQMGISVPEDMAIVSFDCSHISQFAPVPVTSLSHGNNNVGRIAAEKLLAMLDGRSVSSEVVGWTLVERKSG